MCNALTDAGRPQATAGSGGGSRSGAAAADDDPRLGSSERVLEELEIKLEPGSIEERPIASGGFGFIHRAR